MLIVLDGKAGSERSDATDCCGGYAHILIRTIIIEEPAVAVAHETLDEHHRNLAILSPVVERLKDCLLSPRWELGRITLVK